MDVGLRTPLLDFFRRGEVAREVRLLAAEGAVAPRPIEQLGLLALLTTDADAEVRETAERTIGRLPSAQVAALLARSETPTELRRSSKPAASVRGRRRPSPTSRSSTPTTPITGPTTAATPTRRRPRPSA